MPLLGQENWSLIGPGHSWYRTGPGHWVICLSEVLVLLPFIGILILTVRIQTNLTTRFWSYRMHFTVLQVTSGSDPMGPV